jgi:diguanylate cyclase (GGDEF)-like protein
MAVDWRPAMPIPCARVLLPIRYVILSKPNSPLRIFARYACIGLLLAAGLSDVRAAEPHPAQALIDRAEVGTRTDPAASARAANAALELLAIQPNADLEIEARTLLCQHLLERDLPAAEEQLKRARALLPKAMRAGLKSGLLTCEGEMLEIAGDNGKARERYDEAVLVATETRDKEMLAEALYARGYLLGLQGLYAAGLTDLKRAQALFDQLDQDHHALTVINSIATLYNRMSDYAQARDIYERALTAQRAAGMLREQGVTLHNLGRAHENLKQWDAARSAFQESYAVSRGLKYSRGEAYALRGLAAVMNATGDPRGALTTLDRAQALQRQTPDARLNAQIQLARGVALHRIGSLPASIAALQEALQVFSGAASQHELRATYAELAAVEGAMGDWRDAYDYQVKAQETAEQMFRNQLDQRFASLKVEYDTAAKEKENVLLVRENQANQKALKQERRARGLQAIVFLLSVILTVLLATLAVHQWRTTRRMRALAMTDELTGVPNRRAVLSRLEPLLESTNATCAMLIIDIDHFKSINDQHGHPEGDEALKLVAEKLRSQVREPAFIGRLGGEEFVVVLPGADQQEAQRIANEFREEVMTIDTRRWLADRRITVSIGLTTARASGDTSSSMLHRADAALYEAKRAGRNCVRMQPPISESVAASGVAPAGDAAQAEVA